MRHSATCPSVSDLLLSGNCKMIKLFLGLAWERKVWKLDFPLPLSGTMAVTRAEKEPNRMICESRWPRLGSCKWQGKVMRALMVSRGWRWDQVAGPGPHAAVHPLQTDSSCGFHLIGGTIDMKARWVNSNHFSNIAFSVGIAKNGIQLSTQWVSSKFSSNTIPTCLQADTFWKGHLVFPLVSWDDCSAAHVFASEQLELYFSPCISAHVPIAHAGWVTQEPPDVYGKELKVTNPWELGKVPLLMTVVSWNPPPVPQTYIEVLTSVPLNVLSLNIGSLKK